MSKATPAARMSCAKARPSSSSLTLPTKAARAPRLGDADDGVGGRAAGNLDRRTHAHRRSPRPRLVDQRHRALAHVVLDRKSSSVRAMTSTMALPMPSTSKRVAAMKSSGGGKRRAHYSGRIQRGNRDAINGLDRDPPASAAGRRRPCALRGQRLEDADRAALEGDRAAGQVGEPQPGLHAADLALGGRAIGEQPIVPEPAWCGRSARARPRRRAPRSRSARDWRSTCRDDRARRPERCSA